MIHSVRFIVVLDTNVVYPVIIRDILFWFAHYDLYTPKWSEHIFDEWKSVMLEKGVSEEDAGIRIAKANAAFPDALVQNYQGLIKSLELPDENDRHVLAAAIKTNANLIVTNNIKDFPKSYLQSFSLNVKTADDFLTDIIDLNQEQAVAAFKSMVLHKKNPKQDEFEVTPAIEKFRVKRYSRLLACFIIIFIQHVSHLQPIQHSHRTPASIIALHHQNLNYSTTTFSVITFSFAKVNCTT